MPRKGFVRLMGQARVVQLSVLLSSLIAPQKTQSFAEIKAEKGREERTVFSELR